MARAIVDTGPLVAYFDRRDRYNDWASARIEEMRSPLLLCEPVLAEAMYLLRKRPAAVDSIFVGLNKGAFRLAFHIEDQVEALHDLYRRYRERPMSLADACIVRMAELDEDHAVLTLDSDFSVYRKHGSQPLSLIYPARQ